MSNFKSTKGPVNFKTGSDDSAITNKKNKKTGDAHSLDSITRKSRMSVYDMHGRTRKQQNYMPTYRMESIKPLYLDPLQNVIKVVILQSEKYMAKKQMKTTRMALYLADMCSEINTRIKLFNFDRYRLVSIAILSEKYNQSMSIQLGFMWNALEDKWTYYVYDHPSYNIIIIVCGIYFD